MTKAKDMPPTAAIAYTIDQMKAVTGRSRTRIFKAIKDKELTARKDGKRTYVDASEAHRWSGSFPTIGRKPVAA